MVHRLTSPSPRLWISNSKFKKIPFFTLLLTRMNICLDPTKPKESLRSLEQAKNQARAYNQHILLFPEGTRHDDGQIHPFKQGFAHLAEELDRQIIPILIENIHLCYPKNSIIPRYDGPPIRVIIGEPLKQEPQENRKDFIDRIERWFKLNKGACT